MRRPNHSTLLLSVIVLIAMMLPGGVRSQSGRGRPKVPSPGPGAPQPTPITIPAATSVVKQEQSGNVSRFLLRNGITVIISERHSAAIAASVACFKVGTRDEPEALTGVTRMIEHALMGSTRRPVTELRSMGAVTSADTSFEISAYSLAVPSDKVKEALAAQAELLQSFSFDSEQFGREARRMVEEEKWSSGISWNVPQSFWNRAALNGSKESYPSVYSMARLLNIASIGNATIPSSLDKLRSMTQEQVGAFYRTHYRPEKLVIAVAGDIVPFNTLVQIQQLYSGLGTQGQAIGQPGKNVQAAANQRTPAVLPTRPHPPDDASKTMGAPRDTPQLGSLSTAAEQTKLRYGEDRGDLNQPIVSIGYHVPGAEAKDWPVIEVLAALAGMGRASGLNRLLVDGQMAASRVESTCLPLTNNAMLVFQMWPTGDASGASIDKAESAFFREIDRLRHEVPAEAEIARAKALLEKRFLDRTEGYVGYARELARAEATYGSVRAALDYRNVIRAVKAEDVQRAAATYFALSNTSVHEYEPLSAPPRTFDADSFAATVLAWAPELSKSVTPGSVRSADASSFLTRVSQGVERLPQQQAEIESIQPLPVKDFSTLNGPRAFVREDRSLPKVTVALLFQGGRLIEEETNTGTTELMLRSMLYGPPRRIGTQLSQEWEQLGAEIELIVEPDFFGFMFSVVSRNADHTLKLLRDCVEDPAFRDEDIQRARVAQIGAIRDARDTSLSRSRELLFRALYPGAAYGLPPHGREEVVANLTSERLRGWHAALVKRQLPLAIIVGDTNGSALVSSQLAEAFRRRELDAALQVRSQVAVQANDQIELRRCEQTAAAIGLRGPKASNASDQDAVALVQAAMNGIGGRLDRGLVEKGVAVMASLESEALVSAGTIYAQIVIPPSEERQARNALLAEIEKLVKSGLSADETTAARALAAGTKSIALQAQRTRALEYARAVFSQRQPADVEAFSGRLSKVTVDDINRVISTYLKPSAASAGIVRATTSRPPQSPVKQD